MPQFTTENVCYLKHGARKIMARVFKPEGAGPFPCYIDLHGGAWNNGDLEDRTSLGEYMASRGYVMLTLNFRHAAGRLSDDAAGHQLRHPLGQGACQGAEDRPEAGRDRRRLARRPSRDAGGDAAQRSALQRDPRPGRGRRQRPGRLHAVAGDQPAVALQATRSAASAEPNPPALAIGMKKKHDIYWHTEAEMAEGNPMLILERGEKVVMPPAIWLQGRPDEVHDYHDPDGGFPGNEPERFVSNYRKAGGDIEIAYFDNAKRNTETTPRAGARLHEQACEVAGRRAPTRPSPACGGGDASGR